jgi:hypothetical protein
MDFYIDLWGILNIRIILLLDLKHLFHFDFRGKTPEKYLFILNIGIRNCYIVCRFMNKYYRSNNGRK